MFDFGSNVGMIGLIVIRVILVGYDWVARKVVLDCWVLLGYRVRLEVVGLIG